MLVCLVELLQAVNLIDHYDLPFLNSTFDRYLPYHQTSSVTLNADLSSPQPFGASTINFEVLLLADLLLADHVGNIMD